MTSIKSVIDRAAELGGWYVVSSGRYRWRIRRHDKDGAQCPITALCGKRAGKYVESAKSLGLTQDQTDRIVMAADNPWDTDKIRRYMLKKFGVPA